MKDIYVRNTHFPEYSRVPSAEDVIFISRVSGSEDFWKQYEECFGKTLALLLLAGF